MGVEGPEAVALVRLWAKALAVVYRGSEIFVNNYQTNLQTVKSLLDEVDIVSPGVWVLLWIHD